VFDQVVEVLVFAEVSIAEAGVAEQQQLHDHSQREGVSFLRALGALLVYFG